MVDRYKYKYTADCNLSDKQTDRKTNIQNIQNDRQIDRKTDKQ